MIESWLILINILVKRLWLKVNQILFNLCRKQSCWAWGFSVRCFAIQASTGRGSVPRRLFSRQHRHRENTPDHCCNLALLLHLQFATHTTSFTPARNLWPSVIPVHQWEPLLHSHCSAVGLDALSTLMTWRLCLFLSHIHTHVHAHAGTRTRRNSPTCHSDALSGSLGGLRVNLIWQAW